MDFKDYIFRSHMVGKIISVPKPLTENQLSTLSDYELRASGEGRPLTDKQKDTLIELQYRRIQSKKYKLSDGQKKILSELVFAEKYHKKKELNSDQIKKGLDKEKEARDLISSTCNLFLTACNERKHNKWVTGLIDLQPQDVIVDIKTAFSWESYSRLIEQTANEIYLRQGDSYMDLWDKRDFLLCHVLVDTPYEIIDKQIRSYDYKENLLDIEGDVRDEKIERVVQIVSNHIFTEKGLKEYCQLSATVHKEWFKGFIEIPPEDRIHMIPHSFDKVRIEQRNECIALSREYMNTVKPINNFSAELIH